MTSVGTFSLSAQHRANFENTVADWRSANKIQRLWSKDASLWTGADEAKWLGWLDIVSSQLSDLSTLRGVAHQAEDNGYSHVLLLGMGGSSLCPEVLALSFGHQPGFPQMHVLDSTDPAQVLAVQKKIDPAKTLYIVASKSGSTLEPNIFKQYFFEQSGRDGRNWIAITDPGSKMQKVAEADKFSRICFGLPSIGGRYSALSAFGMVPAAAMGIDFERFLKTAQEMVDACSPTTALDENPGAQLGMLLGALARSGRDKLTVVASPGIHDLGAWLEQLVAESTGKIGKGVIPVDRETLGDPSVYGSDRVFIYERLESGADAAQDAAVAALAAAGHPVVTIAVKDAYQLGAEFFRWEIATAVAGAIIGINPFDQPDVEASKLATRRLTDEFEAKGSLPSETPAFQQDGVRVYGSTTAKDLTAALRTLFGTLKPGDYFGVLGYIEMDAKNEASLQGIRMNVRNAKHVATCLGFGPRFLHSTGQGYKGGPNTGVFLQITADDAHDVPVPGQTYSFGVVKAAQARGDLEVLVERGRRCLRFHLGKDVPAGLAIVAAAAKRALTQ